MNAKKIPLKGWVIWFIASLFYAYQYILRVLPNIIISDIMDSFNINSTKLSQFTGIYYIGYSIAHVPIGLTLDRVGPKIVMPICILLTALGLFPIIHSHNVIFLIIGRFISGIGSSGAILSLFKIIRMTFDDKKFSMMLSFAATIGLLGAIYGGMPVYFIYEKFGIKTTLFSFILIGFILAFVSIIIIQKNNKREKNTILKQDLIEIITNKKVIFLSILSGLMVGPLEGFADAWGIEFLNKVYNIKKSSASFLCSIIFVGMSIGGPILSYIATKSRSYMKTIIVSGAIMAAIFILLLLNKLNYQLMMFSFLLVGICSAYQILAIYIISTFVNSNVAVITTAIVNMIIMSFGYAFHSNIGIIINVNGGINDINAMLYGISLIPIAICIALICLLIFEKKSHKN